jgi:hypothetical protein
LRQRNRGHIVGNDAAAVKRHHAVAVAVDDVHIVFDKQHGQGLALQRLHDGVHHGKFFFCRHATGGFVQQQQAFGEPGHGQSDVDELAQAPWQLGHQAIAVLEQIEARQHLVAPA